MENQKIKTSTIFFIIGIFLFVALLFMFAVPQSQFDGNIGGENGITWSIKDVSETTIVILILDVLSFLIWLIKLRSENKRR